MATQIIKTDQFLAKALVEGGGLWPEDWQNASAQSALVERALYHGIAGLLIERSPAGWPSAVVERLRDQAVAQAVWEIRHKMVICQLLTELASKGVTSILLKGTATAYDLYEKPETRTRGDTDILVERVELQQTRQILADTGFRLAQDGTGSPDNFRLQETWTIKSPDGSGHYVDLHWQVMNSMALGQSLSVADCMSSRRPLPRLNEHAYSMDRKTTLIHTCMHRACHLSSPYFMNGVTYYGGDRLIWANDIHLLADALSASEWNELCADSIGTGVAAVCLDGLRFAQDRLATTIPADVLERLTAAGARSKASTYLLRSGQAARAFQDLSAVDGLSNKARYLIQRTLPPAGFLRARYPGLKKHPLALLYIRRVVDLLRKRPQSH